MFFVEAPEQLRGGVLARLSVWSELQTFICPSWRHWHCLLLQVKSRLVLPFWYRLTWVVPEKGPLNGCVCVPLGNCPVCRPPLKSGPVRHGCWGGWTPLTTVTGTSHLSAVSEKQLRHTTSSNCNNSHEQQSSTASLSYWLTSQALFRVRTSCHDLLDDG